MLEFDTNKEHRKIYIMEKLKPYIDAFMVASDRTRRIYLIILGFSGVMLAAFLNSAEFSWNQKELRRARLMYVFVETTIDPSHAYFGSLQPEQEDTAKTYLESKGIRTLEQAKIALNAAERKVSDRSLVQIPLLGLSFHINDLGLVVGVSMLVLLALLKYSLTRESENLDLAMRKAHEFSLEKVAYELLSTGEVLHRPELLEGKKRSILRRPLVDASVIIIFVPVISYALITAHDFSTRRSGYLYTHNYTNFIVWFEHVVLALMVFLVLSCYVIVRDTRLLWNNLRIVIDKKEEVSL